MHTYKLANSIFDGPITNLLSTLCILIEVLLRAHEKGWMAGLGEAVIISCLTILLVFFRVKHGAASATVKGLICVAR